MKSMIDVKHVGSVKSIRHVMTNARGGSVNLPYLNLYVHQMNRYKLEKEKRALLNRLEEIDRQVKDIDEKTRSLKPHVDASMGVKPKKRRGRKGSSGGNGRGRVVKKVRVDY